MPNGVEIGNKMTDAVKRVTETRSFHAGWEIREGEDGSVGLRGYAAVFDSPAHGEVIRRGAFTKTLADGADVRLLINHEGLAIARTRSGTLNLSVDDHGLLFDAPNLDMENPDVRSLISAVKRRDVDQCSFAFSPVRENYDQKTRTRELLEVKLMDVSVVTYPWYEQTSVGLRDSVEKALVEARSNPNLSDEARSLIVSALEARVAEMSDAEAEAYDAVDEAEDATEMTPEMLPEMLRELLARVFAFYVSAHSAHWNVVGPDFSEYHELFGEIYGDVYGSVDPLAENIRKIGAAAPSGLADFVALAGLVPADTLTDARELATRLLLENDALIPEIVEAFDCATMCGEQGIANFLAERQDAHAKWSWQLSASLGVEPMRSEVSESEKAQFARREIARALYLR